MAFQPIDEFMETDCSLEMISGIPCRIGREHVDKDARDQAAIQETFDTLRACPFEDMNLSQRFPMLEGSFYVPPHTIDRANDFCSPDRSAHIGDIPAILEPLKGRFRRGSPWLAGHLIGAAPTLRDPRVGQALGEQTTRQAIFLP